MIDDVHSLLNPGGCFVFSIVHPSSFSSADWQGGEGYHGIHLMERRFANGIQGSEDKGEGRPRGRCWRRSMTDVLMPFVKRGFMLEGMKEVMEDLEGSKGQKTGGEEEEGKRSVGGLPRYLIVSMKKGS
mgnify:CR=1 FL=1